MAISLKEGTRAVEIARQAVDSYVRDGVFLKPIDYPKSFNEDRGVFVTLELYPSHDLRGCIGYPEPVMPLIDALVDGAVSACSRDPRFKPVGENELDELVVEVSVLTVPKLVKAADPSEYPSKIKVGHDGLIIRKGPFSGLLLPQVPVEWGWDEEEFLSQTCNKAGLGMAEWLDPQTELYSFQADVFCEKSPRGEIEPKEM